MMKGQTQHSMLYCLQRLCVALVCLSLVAPLGSCLPQQPSTRLALPSSAHGYKHRRIGQVCALRGGAVEAAQEEREGRWVALNGTSAEHSDTPQALRAAVEKLAADRRQEKSQVQYISTSGSTYTVMWNAAAWDDHISTWRYWRHLRNWYLSTTAAQVAPVALALTLWAALVCYLRNKTGLALTMPMAPLTLVSSALVLLLTLRTNQSFTRLLEARLAWGRLVLHARVLAGIIATRVFPINQAAALLCGRLVCSFAWSARAALVSDGSGRRDAGTPDYDAINALLPPAEAEWVSRQHKPYLAALDRIGYLLRDVASDPLYSDRKLADVPHKIALDMLTELDADVGICERILSSPVPPTYTRFTSRILIIWLACVPLVLGDLNMSCATIVLGTLLTSYVMVGIDEIAIEIEEPMRLLPLVQLCNATMKDAVSRLVPMPPMPPLPTKSGKQQ